MEVLSTAITRFDEICPRHCLFYREHIDAQDASLDLFQLGELPFFWCDLERFPCRRLAMEVAKSKQSTYITYNAANEVVMALF
jgi:1-deoxy-D-xylulose-5-phosphate reductoisomerase